ncbi:hypothetical protein PTSG_04487 [Salpingoeca rosetta]|uniref:Uncharacterized protein n=1 Tax=Salpingoeca rosetta (strain ATCC 50818 / BSB-021) TaxID=946362 RepID=F2U8P9_SALR5|nr:uncharacterized protein PTSG_04487 [Salpingoeca rosetta]EGD72757.1 hypothetical protein PTSG_04487 [Salpingoeca rosetta]|eukprot:XP_004994580.1 hypothetical protein PTSG_04487 [Salpingoeca rosetta]
MHRTLLVASKATTIRVYCQQCSGMLLKYRKQGKGQLVKTFLHKIVKDNTKERCVCPDCGSVFARPAIIKNREANKIIAGRVFWR